MQFYRELKRKAGQLGFGACLKRVPSLAYWALREIQISRGTPEDRLFDATYAVDTCKWVRAGRLDVAEELLPHVNRYEPSRVTALRTMIGQLAINYSDFSFIDLGAGKGRALIVALEHGFREVIGVEISARLSALARQNLAKFAISSGRRAACEVINQDARHYTFPAQNLVVYMYNPFDATILAQVLQNLESAIHRAGTQAVIVYNHPTCRQLLDSCPSFMLQKEQPGFVVYQSN